MDPIRVLIADDEPVSRRGLRQLLEPDPDVVIVGEARNGLEALELCDRLQPDLLLLDVVMPGVDGIDVVTALAGRERPAVIFVTAHDEFAIQAFDHHAVDYVLKPFSGPRVRTAVRRGRGRLGSVSRAALAAALEPVARPPERFVVRVGHRTLLIDVNAVEWIQGADNYVRLHCGERSYLVRQTLQSLERRLATGFVRVHRSALVRWDRVRELERDQDGGVAVHLVSGARLPVSRRCRGNLEAQLGGRSRSPQR